MARHPRASMLLEIAVGTAILAVALFTIIELARVAGMMQLDRIFSYGQNDRAPMPTPITGSAVQSVLGTSLSQPVNWHADLLRPDLLLWRRVAMASSLLSPFQARNCKEGGD